MPREGREWLKQRKDKPVTDVTEEKRGIRKAIKSLSDELTPEYLKLSDEEIFKGVIRNDRYQAAETVFIYVSTGNEPDTTRLIDEALKSGKTVCVPKCGKKPFMKAVRIGSLKDLKEGAYGIPEPESDAEFEGKIDLAVIPCVSATADGVRLGHGGGFYDCFLEKRETYKICLCRRKLMMEKLPAEASDVVMDEVIADK